MSDPLSDHPRAFRLAVRVSASDIDVQNHASNVAVLSWMNQAAWEHSVALGWPAGKYQRLGAMWVVRRHEILYHQQAMLGDDLLCLTWLGAMSKVAADRHHKIFRPADGAVIAEGVNTWAFISIATGRPTRIPPQIAADFDPAKCI